MPDFEFTGLTDRTYAQSKDAHDGSPVGTVKPGAVLELDEPLDADWLPYDDGEKPEKDAAEPASSGLAAGLNADLTEIDSAAKSLADTTIGAIRGKGKPAS